MTSKRLRYEILRRDNHACRYCGAAAPDAKLTVDHVVPIALGGTDEPSNLVAACIDCNAGKSSSHPDAPIIADVSADDLRWGSAIARAASTMVAAYDSRQQLRDLFGARWDSWTYNGQHLPAPNDWQHSIDSILSAGLPIEVVLECVDIAMSKKHVAPESKFRYMCGVAWKKVSELREIAASLLAEDEPEFPPDWTEGDGYYDDGTPVPMSGPQPASALGLAAEIKKAREELRLGPPPADLAERISQPRAGDLCRGSD